MGKNKKVINISLNIRSIEKAINELKFIKSIIPQINEEFMNESLTIIQNNAINNLVKRVKNFPNSANINNNWNINKAIAKSGGNALELRNDNKVVALVEFGTGIVGKSNAHKLSQKLGYQYDVNNHAENGWNFDVIYKNEYYHFRGFKGYEGKSFLYDSFFDYFLLGEWKNVYQRIYDKYI